MRTWIFRANSEVLDIEGYLAAPSGLITWRLAQYAALISPGDSVYIWRSSSKAYRERAPEAQPNTSKTMRAAKAMGSFMDDADFSHLRNEIIELMKFRQEFMKFKIQAVAILGAVGIWAYNIKTADAVVRPELILAIVPLVCIYADALIYNQIIKVLVIGQFLKSRGDQYENYIEELGKHSPKVVGTNNFFSIQEWAISYPTKIISMLVVICGIYFMITRNGMNLSSFFQKRFY